MNSESDLMQDFVAAIKNEIAVDDFFLNVAKFRSHFKLRIPRVPVWSSYAERFPNLVIFFYAISILVWSLGLFLLFFTFQFALLISSFAVRDKRMVIAQNGMILGFSSRALEIVRDGSFDDLPRACLTFPWVSSVELGHNYSSQSFYDLLDFRDFFAALRLACASSLVLLSDRSLRPWVIQGYVAFKWFLVRLAVDKIEGTVVTAEHYDRWAVLADRSVMRSKLNTKKVKNLVLIQHGVMSDLSASSGQVGMMLDLPTRLASVDFLYCYNDREKLAFMKNVISPDCLNIKTSLFQMPFSVASLGDSRTPSILFVGHSICESFHVSLLFKICEQCECDIYYKPHPKTKMSAELYGFKWTVIDDEKFYPKVDLLISYPSTLVEEYKSIGIDAVVHGLDSNLDDANSIVEQVLYKLACAKSPIN